MSIALTAFFQEHIEIAAPNMISEFRATPNDESFDIQKSLNNSTFDIQRAWDTTTGHPNVKIAICDAGVDYMHCDLGGGIGAGYKIVYGYNFATNTTNVRRDSTEPLSPFRLNHGTKIAGIIGAITNYNCGDNNRGVAGINGGWYPESIGSPLYFFGIASANPTPSPYKSLNSDFLIRALLDGANSYKDAIIPYGYEIDVFNLSLGEGLFKSATSEPIRHAIFSAYNNGAVVVAAAGNQSSNAYDQVSCNDPQTVINVGSANYDNTKIWYSNHNEYVDILAYGGKREPHPDSSTNPVYNVYTTTTVGEQHIDTTYTWVEGTSFAAPHITGLVSLLQSYEKQKTRPELLHPEDYEGIIKANTFDVSASPAKVGYDTLSGWGVAKAGQIFSRYANDGYAVYHRQFKDTINFSKSAWSEPISLHIANVEGVNTVPLPGFYTVRLRTWTRYDVLVLSQWKRGNGNNVYVWGRGGAGLSHSGWDSLPFSYIDSAYHQSHYKNNYTVINSGDGGNGKVKGIIHSNNSLISASTFQYQVCEGDSLVGIYPPNEKIGVNFSIYGALVTPTSVEESHHNATDVSIQPSIITTKSTLSFIFSLSGQIEIQVTDVHGRVIIKKQSEYQEGTTGIETLDLSDFSNGHYIITLLHTLTGEVLQTKCAILR